MDEVQVFHHRIIQNTYQLIDLAAGGSLGNKTLKAAKQMIEEIAINNYQWNSRWESVTKAARILEISEV